MRQLLVYLSFIFVSFWVYWLYIGFHAMVLFPIFGRRRKPCDDGDMIATPFGRVEGMTYSLGFSPMGSKIIGRLICGEDADGSNVVLPINHCPESVFFEPEILHTFINRRCLPLDIAQGAFDRLTVRPDNPRYPPNSFVVYERPWDHSPRYTFAYHDLNDAPAGEFYVHLKSEGFDLYEEIDSFIERIHRNASIPTTEQIAANRFACILHGTPISSNRWTNYVEYTRDWQRLVHTVLMEKDGDHPECCICYDEEANPGPKAYVHCGHSFHTSCVTEWVTVSGRNECPFCRTRNII